jgi:hypothetical protein
MPTENKRTHQERIYLNHIKRLQAQNQMLLDAVHYERQLRREAWEFYRKRLKSKFWFIVETVLFAAKEVRNAD